MPNPALKQFVHDFWQSDREQNIFEIFVETTFILAHRIG
jgi:hypothetical protein